MVPFVRAPLRVHRQRRLRVQTNVEQQTGRWNCTTIYLRPGCLRPRRPALVHRPHHRFQGQPRPPARHPGLPHPPIRAPPTSETTSAPPTTGSPSPSKGSTSPSPRPVPQPTPGCDRIGCTPAVERCPAPDSGRTPVTRFEPSRHTTLTHPALLASTPVKRAQTDQIRRPPTRWAALQVGLAERRRHDTAGW
jgi:hypothetical protein